jgi:ribosome maturation factor RimP
MYHDIPEGLRVHIEPIVADHHCELVNVERSGGQSATILRVIVDSERGDGRVDIDVLARLSREIEAQLDAADAVAGAYRLELSSPGLDRVLAREKDFLAAVGGKVKLKSRRPIEGRRQFKGRLTAFEDGHAVIEVDGKSVSVPFEAIEKANRIYEFTSADFAGPG